MENEKPLKEINFGATLPNDYALQFNHQWFGTYTPVTEKITLTKNGEILAELEKEDAERIFNFGLFLLKQRTE